MKSRKELKEEYKQMKFPMGVFQIRNLENGKIYIGSSLDLDANWRSLKFQLNADSFLIEQLQKDWNQMGADHFVYEILDEIKADDSKNLDYKKEIKALEEMYIESLQPFDDKGYNWKRK